MYKHTLTHTQPHTKFRAAEFCVLMKFAKMLHVQTGGEALWLDWDARQVFIHSDEQWQGAATKSCPVSPNFLLYDVSLLILLDNMLDLWIVFLGLW